MYVALNKHSALTLSPQKHIAGKYYFG